MSACIRYPDDDQILRYVGGDLDEADLAAFEDHLFACDDCLARVERYQAAQQVLAARELPPAPALVSSAADARPRSPRAVPAWMLGTVAAGLVVAVGALWSWQQVARAPQSEVGRVVARAELEATPPVEVPAAGPSNVSSSTALQVAVLAMVTPPPYLPLTTRGDGSTPARFDEGMRAYTRQEWPAAARLLTDVDTAEARFYKGVADLMRGDSEGATAALAAARRSGVEPYARESVFYLGKAALQHGDIAAARDAFSAARSSGASTSREAARLLASLDELAPAR